MPYKELGPALNDLLGGQVDMTFTDILTRHALYQDRQGQGPGHGQGSSAPDIPTIAERGVKGHDVSVFFGVVAPKGTPGRPYQGLEPGVLARARLRQGQQRLAQQGWRLVRTAARPIWQSSSSPRWTNGPRWSNQAGVQLDGPIPRRSGFSRE